MILVLLKQDVFKHTLELKIKMKLHCICSYVPSYQPSHADRLQYQTQQKDATYWLLQ